MLSDDEAVYLEKLVDPDLPYQFASRVGGRIPLHCTAMGKALLAAMDRAIARELLGRRELVRRTANTLVTVDALRRRARTRSARAASRSTTRRTSATSAASAPRCATTAALPSHAISVSALTVEVSVDDALALGPRVVAAAARSAQCLAHHRSMSSGSRPAARSSSAAGSSRCATLCSAPVAICSSRCSMRGFAKRSSIVST